MQFEDIPIPAVHLLAAGFINWSSYAPQAVLCEVDMENTTNPPP